MVFVLIEKNSMVKRTYICMFVGSFEQTGFYSTGPVRFLSFFLFFSFFSFLLELVSRRQGGGLFLQDFIQNKLNQDPAFESRPPICEKRGPPPWPQIYM